MKTIEFAKAITKALVVIGVVGITSSGYAAQRHGGKPRFPGGGGRPTPPRQFPTPPRSQPRGGHPVLPTPPPPRGQAPRSGAPVRLPNNVVPPAPAPVQAPIRYRYVQTSTGVVYDNGIQLRFGFAPRWPVLNGYFPTGVAYFPYYMPYYARNTVSISPYAYFFGYCAPYLNPSNLFTAPPQSALIDMPVFDGNACLGFGATQDENLLGIEALAETAPGLEGAIDDVVQTYQYGDINALVPLVNPRAAVAVFLKGNYRYSLGGSDFADLTRDAIRQIKMAKLQLVSLHRRGPNAYSLSTTESYNDSSGNPRTVYMSFVLEVINGHWAMTQIGTAPDQIQAWQ